MPQIVLPLRILLPGSALDRGMPVTNLPPGAENLHVEAVEIVAPEYRECASGRLWQAFVWRRAALADNDQRDGRAFMAADSHYRGDFGNHLDGMALADHRTHPGNMFLAGTAIQQQHAGAVILAAPEYVEHSLMQPGPVAVGQVVELMLRMPAVLQLRCRNAQP